MAESSREVIVSSGGDTNATRSPHLECLPFPIISAPLNGNNWLAWSRAVRIALGGRDKLSFIDGTYVVNAYLYANLARALWLELEANAGHLMQFLMGLNDSFDGVRSQILVMEPLPHVDKAYSMVMRVERQRKVHLGAIDAGINTVMYARNIDQDKNVGYKNFVKKKVVDKKLLTCASCGRTGHTKETCFKIHGVPNWYKELNGKRRREMVMEELIWLWWLTKLQTRQDRMTKEVLAVSNQVGNLLHLTQQSFSFAVKNLYSRNRTESINLSLELMIMSCGTNALGTLLPIDVTFHESFFPYKDGSSSPHNYPIPLPIGPTDIDHSFYPNPAPSLDFTAILSTLHEPQIYAKAKDHVDWQQAMQQELTALESNETWEVTKLSPNKKAIGCKWVYKVKLKQDGSVDRFKARLVAKGYNQVEGIDYIDSFSPVAKAVTVRIFLAIASGYGWPIHQADINNAFLNGYLDEDIYMIPPEGYAVPAGQVPVSP
ncbi:UNVERIFIED_CONTAM: Retrovirus-related Pol polyprotein from transposon RE1 [Sesamum radiatum]|uniref:Retrovirus-related Pol polyprotein from transposon RE1 n=1 Tax=Sesamum radiatum TaxID=300843 RepID=A0AAW2S0P6_SESRA